MYLEQAVQKTGFNTFFLKTCLPVFEYWIINQLTRLRHCLELFHTNYLYEIATALFFELATF